MNAQTALQECIELQKRKNQDYTGGTNRMENFERSSIIASWFKRDEDKSFAVLIGTKLARLASLLNKSNNRNSKPNFESIEDTFKDGINYFALWGESSCPDYTSNWDKSTADLSHLKSDIKSLLAGTEEYVNSHVIAESPLKNKDFKRKSYKEEALGEITSMYYDLTDEDFRVLLVEARIRHRRNE